MTADRFDRIGLVVHPERPLDRPLAAIIDWAHKEDAEVVQIVTPGGSARRVAPTGEAADCDLVIALGGDGTTLAALHAAAPASRPVLGVACGSLGALTATGADRLADALDRVAAGNWRPRPIPALVSDLQDRRLAAVNDLVLVRDGAGQVTISVAIDGEVFIRYAGDGLIAATPLGSTAYTLAVGGPMLAPGSAGLVLTPLAAHGGVCPPLVTTPATRIEVTLDPGHGGARVEVDGQIHHTAAPFEPHTFVLAYEPRFADLVMLGDEESTIAGLRRRKLLLDSPRVLARDARLSAAPAP